MSREVVIQAWCDVCQDGHEKTPATVSTTATFGKLPPREIDLCDKHRRPLEDAVQLFERYGRGAKTATRCELCSREFQTVQGLGTHLARVHKKKSADGGK